MTEQERQGRETLPQTIERLKAELKASQESEAQAKAQALQAKQQGNTLRLKVSEKGAVSVYGLGRFPVTQYKEQWLRLLDFSPDIRAFILENDSLLKAKGQNGKGTTTTAQTAPQTAKAS